MFPYYCYDDVWAINKNWKKNERLKSRKKTFTAFRRIYNLRQTILTLTNKEYELNGKVWKWRSHQKVDGRHVDVYSSGEESHSETDITCSKLDRRWRGQISVGLKLRASRNYKRSPFVLESSIISTLNIACSSGRLVGCSRSEIFFSRPYQQTFRTYVVCESSWYSTLWQWLPNTFTHQAGNLSN